MTMNDAQAARQPYQAAVDVTQLNPDSFGNRSYWNVQPVFDVSDLLDDEPPKTASTLRLSALREVFGLFDTKLSDSIERSQLMALGSASQTDRLWTEDKNTELLERMVLNRDGLVDESEFCKWFELALPQDQAVFEMVIAELKQVAVAVRSAADNTSSPMRDQLCEKTVQEPQHIGGALRPPSQAERKMEADMGAAVAALSAEMATSAVEPVLTPESFGNIDYWNVKPAFDVSDLLDDEPRPAATSTSGKMQATNSNRDIPVQTQLEIPPLSVMTMNDAQAARQPYQAAVDATQLNPDSFDNRSYWNVQPVFDVSDLLDDEPPKTASTLRLSALREVFGLFDTKLSHSIERSQLMALGSASQTDRLWTEDKNI